MTRTTAILTWPLRKLLLWLIRAVLRRVGIPSPARAGSPAEPATHSDSEWSVTATTPDGRASYMIRNRIQIDREDEEEDAGCD
jgi:hypothetical protein